PASPARTARTGTARTGTARTGTGRAGTGRSGTAPARRGTPLARGRGDRLDLGAYAEHLLQDLAEVVGPPCGKSRGGPPLGDSPREDGVLQGVHGRVAELGPGHLAPVPDRVEDLRPALADAVGVGCPAARRAGRAPARPVRGYGRVSGVLRLRL